jgi:hypothetical protein
VTAPPDPADLAHLARRRLLARRDIASRATESPWHRTRYGSGTARFWVRRDGAKILVVETYFRAEDADLIEAAQPAAVLATVERDLAIVALCELELRSRVVSRAELAAEVLGLMAGDQP